MRCCAAFGLALLLGFVSSGSARAVTISVGTALGAGNTPDATGSYQSYRTAASVLDAGGTAADSIGQQIDAAAVYRGVGVADDAYGVSLCPGSTTSGCRVHVYDVTLFTYADPGVVYDLAIQSEVFARLQLFDDGSGDAWSVFRPVTGTLNGVSNTSLGLPGTDGWQASAYIATNVVRQNLLTITGLSGAQTFALRYTWQTAVGSNNDEALMGLGLTPLKTNCTLCTLYTGIDPSGRQYGFYVTATAEVTSVPVPEPATVSLLALGFVALVRRRLPACA